MKNFLGEEERNSPENIPYTYDARSVTGPQRIAVTSVYSTFPYKIYMFTSITNTVNHGLLRLGRQVAGFKQNFMARSPTTYPPSPIGSFWLKIYTYISH